MKDTWKGVWNWGGGGLPTFPEVQGILFIGVQASGKSTFYVQRFFRTHVRISMDLLNTRNKEQRMLETCVDLQQRVVIDNTNPTAAERARYIAQLRAAKYNVVGYYFRSSLSEVLDRNGARPIAEQVPRVGILGTHKRLELPSLSEGFDELYYISIDDGEFVVNDWQDEV